MWRAHGTREPTPGTTKSSVKRWREKRRELEGRLLSKILCTPLSHLISVCKGSLLRFTDGETRLGDGMVKALVTDQGWKPPLLVPNFYERL